MDEIVFSRHCRAQMQERNISEKQILDCLKKPDKISFQSDGRLRVIKKVLRLKKVYLIIVVFEQLPERKEIITAFYTSKLNKYL